MTGKDLIIYILQNNLENEEVFKDGKLLGFVSVYEAAAKLEVGTAAIRAMIELAGIETLVINHLVYIPVTELDTFKTVTTEVCFKRHKDLGGPLDE